MSLLTLRTAVVSALEPLLDPVTVDSHGGKYDLTEIRRWGATAPTVRIALLGVDDGVDEGGIASAVVRMAAFAVAKDTSTTTRDDGGIALMEAIVSGLLHSYPTGYTRPKRMAAENLYSGALDNSGVSIWAVTWQQPYDFGELDHDELDALDDMEQIDIKHDLHDSTESTDSEDLIDLGQ